MWVWNKWATLPHFTWIWMPLLPLLHNNAWLASSLCCFSVQFSCPCVYYASMRYSVRAHKQHIQCLQPNVYERTKTHIIRISCIFIHIFLFWVYFCVPFALQQPIVLSSSLFLSSSSFLFFQFAFFSLFGFSVPFTLLVPFCASPFSAKSSFIINKRVQSIKWNETKPRSKMSRFFLFE